MTRILQSNEKGIATQDLNKLFFMSEKSDNLESPIDFWMIIQTIKIKYLCLILVKEIYSGQGGIGLKLESEQIFLEDNTIKKLEKKFLLK